LHRTGPDRTGLAGLPIRYSDLATILKNLGELPEAGRRMERREKIRMVFLIPNKSS
jgi:hypothetical protein